MTRPSLFLRLGSFDYKDSPVRLDWNDGSYLGQFVIGETVFMIDAMLESDYKPSKPIDIPGMQARPRDRVFWGGVHYLVTIFPADP